MWSYEEICDMEFRIILGSDCYTLDENTGLYTDLRGTQAGLKYLYDNGTVLKVSGIVRPNTGTVSGMLTGTIGYTSKLTEYIIEHAEGSDAVQAQLADPSTDIFTGLPFRENTGNLSDEQKAEDFRTYISQLNETGKAQAYLDIMSIPPDEQVDEAVEQTLSSMTRAEMEETMLQALTEQTSVGVDEVRKYISAMDDGKSQSSFPKWPQNSSKLNTQPKSRHSLS